MPRQRVGYRLTDHEIRSVDDVVWVYEDASMVLLGGEVWPAAFVVSEYLCSFLNFGPSVRPMKPHTTLTIIELGAGAGLCGLVALATALKCGRKYVDCFLTDETHALCEVNLAHFRASIPATLHTSLPLNLSDRFMNTAARATCPTNFSAQALELSWGCCPSNLAPALVDACRSANELCLIGCEVTPMLQTQLALLDTVHTLLSISPKLKSASTRSV
jgi:hypothetical protein